MKQIFIENYKLKKISNILSLIFCIIYGIVIYPSRGFFNTFILSIIVFLFLEVLFTFIISFKDQKKLTSILQILYNQCNANEFIKTMDEKIDISLLKPITKSTMLSHKANAYCYTSQFTKANKILDEIISTSKLVNEIALARGNKISYKIIENNFDNIDEEIEEYELFLNNSNNQSSLNKSHKRNLVQKKIQLKIARNIRLNSNEIESLWNIMKESGNKLNLETLRYYSALYSLNEKDIPGAMEQLIEFDPNNVSTIIREKAIILLKNIQNNKASIE